MNKGDDFNALLRVKLKLVLNDGQTRPYNQKGDKTIWSHDLGEKHHIWERKPRATT